MLRIFRIFLRFPDTVLRPAVPDCLIFTASGLSLADLAFFNLVHDFFAVINHTLDEARFPKLCNVVNKTAQVPEMAAWLAARPQSKM